MVPNKYLPSHLGEIPNDWNRVAFSDVMSVRQGLQIAISKRLKVPTDTSKEYITIQSIKKTEQLREYVETPSKRVICNREDVLMTRTGNTGIVVTDVEGVFHNNFFLMDFDRLQIDKVFLVNYLRSPRVQHLILTKAGASTIPDLNHKDFYSIEFPLPPLPEQCKIAKILSTWDKAITTTEKLIASSQQQKKALMQQLLTGKKRLVRSPEKKGETGMVFEGDWELKQLDEVCSKPISYGIVQTGQDIKDGIPCVRVVDLTKNEFNICEMIKSSEEIHQSYKKTILEKGELMMALRGEIGLVRIVPEHLIDTNITRGIARLAPKLNVVDSGFLLWMMRSNQVVNDLKRKAGGSALQEISLTALRKVKVLVPSLPEQQKIASVLTAADKEIELLQAKLAHLKQEKKALMQQLLTGKRRVKAEAT